MALWYDPAMTLGVLEERGVTENVFKNWIELFDHFKDGFELRRVLFGLSSILKLEMNNLPKVKSSELWLHPC